MGSRGVGAGLVGMVLWCTACQGDAPAPAPRGPQGSSGPVVQPSPIDAAGPRQDGAAATSGETFLAELGAVPAWGAVIERARLLGRRRDHGVIYGIVGGELASSPDAPRRWLIDDQEGDGALGVIVAWPAGIAATAGARVAIGGAWTFAADKRWVWQADIIEPVPAPPAARAELATAMPGLLVTTQPLPAGSLPISRAVAGGTMIFTVVGVPASPGEGWRIARELGDPPEAVLYLPGERESYGGRDFRSADERWQLRRGVTYWVKVQRVRRGAAGEPARITAAGAPAKW